MEHEQRGAKQRQSLGDGRRAAQVQYQGDERRKPKPPAGDPDPGTPAMSVQERKEKQEERSQQQEKHHDQH